MIQTHRHHEESLVTGTVRKKKVETHLTEEEEAMAMIAHPRRPLVVVVEVEVEALMTLLTEIQITVRVLGARVKPTMTRSLRKNIVTEGWERAARQQDRVKITPGTNHPRDPPHPSKEKERS